MHLRRLQKKKPPKAFGLWEANKSGKISGGALLAGQENVLGAGIFQHLARALRCMHTLTVDGDKDAAGLDLLFVAPGFNLGKSEADETSGYASHRATYAGSRQCGDDRSCSEQRSHTGNR